MKNKSKALLRQATPSKGKLKSTAFEARFLEKNIENDLEIPIDQHSDRKETIFMIFESLEERITTTFELKDGEVISNEEKMEKINPDHESYVRLNSLLCSGEDTQKVYDR